MIPQKKINEIFVRLSAKDPQPKIELNYTNNYTLLIAVVLSAQSTDVRVNQITKELFLLADNPQKMLNLGLEKLKRKIKSIGLYNSKAKNIINLSKKLIDDGKNDIPCDFDYLISLPGVGRKSANVILNSAFGQLTIGVDTHVFRVSNRIGFSKTKNVLATEKRLLKIVQKQFLRNCHHWLVLHGRYICKAKKPMCDKCHIADLCEYNKAKLASQSKN
ncbi:MAG: endonuclease III [Rickettsiaceae bacterium H1]|nr:endonuclease III [Rickettsiaceae bacterium H1]